jgi:hypothetical protein
MPNLISSRLRYCAVKLSPQKEDQWNPGVLHHSLED